MIIAMLLGIIPGLGLIYIDKKGFGITIMIIAIISFLLCLTGIFAIIGGPILILNEIIAFFATVIGVLNYRGGWKWL